MVDLEDLKAKALEATPGEWTLRDRGVICGGPLVQYFKGQGRPQIVMCCGGEHIGHEQKTANERFIAAAYPDAVLRLIDRLEKSEAERDALKAELKATQSRLHEVAVGCANAEFELEAPIVYLCREKDGDLDYTKYNPIRSGTAIFNHRMKSENWEVIPVYASPVPAQTKVDLSLIYNALTLSMCICDSVPTNVHLPECGASEQFQEIGRLVNAQENGFHGYAIIRDARDYIRNMVSGQVPVQQSVDVTHEYPMQPMFLDNKGLPRFEKNPIVDRLCEKHGLNEIGIWWQVNNIERKYIEQLYQLIGYSIRGYEELSEVSDSSCSMAHQIAEQLLKGGENER